MNVYDFDGTIYNGDSTLNFYFYCLRKNLHLLRYLPRQVLGFLKYVLGVHNKTMFKQAFYCFLQGLEDVDALIDSFWDENIDKVERWYLSAQKSSDLVISASPEFLLRPVCNRLGIENLIGSKVDKNTGKYTGENCHGPAKVKAFTTVYGNQGIDKFYSDSLSDQPMADLGAECFFVSKKGIVPWSQYKPSMGKKLKSMFFSREFMAFFGVGCVNAFNGVLFASLLSIFLVPNLAFILGYLLSLTISYFLNSCITFKQRLTWAKYVKFCLSYVYNFIVQNLCVLVFYNILGWSQVLTYILAAAIGFPVTFVIVKVFVYLKK